jgi:hypothetical protein
MYLKLATGLDVRDGQIFARDISLKDIQFTGTDITPGSMQYSFLQAVSVGAFESMKEELASTPVADLNEGNMVQRLGGRILEDLRFDENVLMVSIAPGRAAGSFFPLIIAALGALVLLAGRSSGKRSPERSEG